MITDKNFGFQSNSKALSNIEGKAQEDEKLNDMLTKMRIRQKDKVGEKREQDDVLKEDPIAAVVVNEMNMRFGVLEQPTFLILEEGEEGSFSLDKKGSFRDRFQNQKIVLEDGSKKSKADLFLESERRRTFWKITMNPSKTGHYEEGGHNYFNLWRGFAFMPIPGRCERFKQHTLEVICAADKELYEYVMNLLAYWIQRPEERTVAILIRGPQGCGKNIWAEAIGALFGRAFGVYDDVERLLGKFNADLATKVLILADEAFWGGRRGDNGKLKAAITAESFWLESKGKDKVEIKNFRKWVAASNERFALPLDPDDRRWLILDCAGHRARDNQYFNEFTDELKNGGYEALLSELQTRDVSQFNPRLLPPNDNAFDMKLKSASSFLRYLYEVLYYERFDLAVQAVIPWEKEATIQVAMLRLYYQDYSRKERFSLQGDEECGHELSTLFKDAGFKKSRLRYAGTRQPTYIFPHLQVCRRIFANYFRVTVERIFPNEEEVG